MVPEFLLLFLVFGRFPWAPCRYSYPPGLILGPVFLWRRFSRQNLPVAVPLTFWVLDLALCKPGATWNPPNSANSLRKSLILEVGVGDRLATQKVSTIKVAVWNVFLFEILRGCRLECVFIRNTSETNNLLGRFDDVWGQRLRPMLGPPGGPGRNQILC